MKDLKDYSDFKLPNELKERGYVVLRPREAWQTDSLWELLVDRYNVSRHVTIQKMLDLVKTELSI